MTDQAITYVELDLDYCSLSYGVGACPAVLGVDSATKCYNTRATCPVLASFSNAPVTLRFSESPAYRPLDIEAIPSISDLSFSPAEISLGKDLGVRASLKVTFDDHPYSDTGEGFDKYLGERSYDPWSQGTFWGKFRARQPYLRGRVLRWVQGLVGEALADMDTATFVMESFDGPALNGKFSIKAQDILKLADGDRAKAPALSKGYLSTDITSSATSAALVPAGIGSNYPASGYLAIGGNEICSFTRSGDALTLVRGLFGTTGVAHNAGDRCQLCVYYQAQDPANIIRDLLVNYAGVADAYIPLANWLAETAAYYGRVNTAMIAEPTSVRTLVSELIEQCGMAVWWDMYGQQIRLQMLREIPTTAKTFTDAAYTDGSLVVKEQPDKRISQVWTYYGQRNPLEGSDDPSNFRSTALTVDTDNEHSYGSASIKTIYSRWIPFGGLTAAQRVNDIQLARFKVPPRRFTFDVFRRDDSITPVLGEGCQITGHPMQDADGSAEIVPMQIVQLKPDADLFSVVADEMRFAGVTYDTGTRSIAIDADINSINLRSLHDALYPAPSGGETVTATVYLGVVVGADDTTGPALDIGTWPSLTRSGTKTSGSPIITGLSATGDLAVGMRVTGTGIQAGSRIASINSSSQITLDKNATSGGTVTLTIYTVVLNLVVLGRLQGAGGAGGNGAASNGSTQQAGDGGVALYTRYPINIDLTTAKIYGGGGGGGGGVGAGGGGAGREPGAAGADGGFAGITYYSYAQPGTLNAGGAGTDIGGTTKDGGAGGGPGLAGSDSPIAVGRKGAAGNSIDGTSWLLKTGTGDIRGSEVN